MPEKSEIALSLWNDRQLQVYHLIFQYFWSADKKQLKQQI